MHPRALRDLDCTTVRCLDNHCMIMAIGRDAWGLQKSKGQKGWGGGPAELQAGQPVLLGKVMVWLILAYEGQETQWEWSSWIHQWKIIFDKHDDLIWWNDWLCGWGKSSGHWLRVDTVYRDYHKALKIVSNRKPMKCGLDKQLMRCIEQGLEDGGWWHNA